MVCSMKLLSMAKTTAAVRDGIPVHVVHGELVFPTLTGVDLVPWSEAFDIRPAAHGLGDRLYKDVTRRGGWKKEKGKPAAWRRGWTKAKSGDMVELVEWLPRVGSRWVCGKCGELGSTARHCLGLLVSENQTPAGNAVERWIDSHPCGAEWIDHPCGAEWIEWRAPQRLGVRRIVSADPVRLADIDDVDLIREGFPGMSPEDFVKMYCAPKPPYPQGIVTRLALGLLRES